MTKKLIYISMLAMMSAACSQGGGGTDNIASQTVNDIVCPAQLPEQVETNLWDGLKTYLIETKTIPTAKEMKASFQTQLKTLAETNPQIEKSKIEQVSADLSNLVQSLLDEAPKGERVQTADELLILLSAIDVGDRSTTFRSYIQDKVRENFNKLQKSMQGIRSYNLKCTPGTGGGATQPDPELESRDYQYHKQQALSRGEPLAVFGGRWAFATSYQSCQSVQLPSMNDQTQEIEGIKIVGTHSDGVGSKRMISSLADVQRSHYYIKDSSHFGQGCFDVKSNPLIYDYGGKPYATTASNAAIDMFKNNGSGTSVLGIDCSGYVYSSMATAGLRLKAGRALKASDSWAWGSGSYLEPEQNGLTCLSKITIRSGESLKAGDIVAVRGHVLLIDKASVDPFGIAGARSEADCNNISTDQFDFSVAQSSPSKNGIGLNIYEARNYLPTSEKMKAGLLRYAQYACLAKVTGKTYTPSIGTLSVVRHRGTAECMAPRVKMARESCIQTCNSLTR